MSKQKLRLQLVNKTWKEALESPAAHSYETKDCGLPFAGKGVSQKVTRALSQCTSTVSENETDRNCAGWLGPGLQELNLCFESCDVRSNLSKA